MILISRKDLIPEFRQSANTESRIVYREIKCTHNLLLFWWNLDQARFKPSRIIVKWNICQVLKLLIVVESNNQ